MKKSLLKNKLMWFKELLEIEFLKLKNLLFHLILQSDDSTQKALNNQLKFYKSKKSQTNTKLTFLQIMVSDQLKNEIQLLTET